MAPGEGGRLLDGFVQIDLGEFAQVVDLLRRVRPDLVFHLAGIHHGEAKDIYRTNVMGAVHLLEAVRLESHSARVLFVGSAAEYGLVGKEELPITEDIPCRPQGPYGLSKYASTLAGLNWCRQYGMKIVIARPFNIIGAGMPQSLVVGAILARARKALAQGGNPVVKVGNLDSERDFVAVDDTVDAYVRMLEGNRWGEVFNICSGRPYAVRDVVEMLLSFAPRRVQFEVDPTLLRSHEGKVIYGSYGKAKEAFGFVPATPLHDALRLCWSDSVPGISQ